MIPFRRIRPDADTVGLVGVKSKSNPRGVGRSPRSGKTSKLFSIRLAPAEHAAYAMAAKAAGQTLSDWIRASCDARLPKRGRG